MRGIKALGIAGLVSCSLAFASGCSAPRDRAEEFRVRAPMASAAAQLRAEGHVEQAELLEDGAVSTGDYHAAFSLYSRCLREDGMDVTDASVSPVDGLSLLFGVESRSLAADAAPAVQDACRERHFAVAEDYFLGSHEPIMDERLLRATLECAASRGIEVSPDARSFPDMMAGWSTAGDAEWSDRVNGLAGCISDSAARLFPDLPGIDVPLPQRTPDPAVAQRPAWWWLS
jgi:hypothetical protein